MIIAHRRGNYIRPHRQDASKMYVMVEGELLVLIFDEAGNLAQRFQIAGPARGAPFCVRLEPGFWHTTYALSETAVVCEVLGSPNPDGRATEHAAWAPEEGQLQAIQAFFDKLGLAVNDR